MRLDIAYDFSCGSGSFFVQAMVKELADCENERITDVEKRLKESIKKNNITVIEINISIIMEDKQTNTSRFITKVTNDEKAMRSPRC